MRNIRQSTENEIANQHIHRHDSLSQVPTSARSTASSCSAKESFYVPFISSRSTTSAWIYQTLFPSFGTGIENICILQEPSEEELPGADLDVGRKIKKVEINRILNSGSCSVVSGAALDSLLAQCCIYLKNGNSSLLEDNNALADKAESNKVSQENNIKEEAQSLVREIMKNSLNSSAVSDKTNETWGSNNHENLVLRQELAVLRTTLLASEEISKRRAEEFDKLAITLTRELSRGEVLKARLAKTHHKIFFQRLIVFWRTRTDLIRRGKRVVTMLVLRRTNFLLLGAVYSFLDCVAQHRRLKRCASILALRATTRLLVVAWDGWICNHPRANDEWGKEKDAHPEEILEGDVEPGDVRYF